MSLWTLALFLANPGLAVSEQAAGVQKIILSRGERLPGQAIGYWAVEDTTLDVAAPDKNLGGSHFLTAGPGKTVLLKFGDLRRILGSNAKIVRAKIVLTVSGGAPAPLQTLAEVQVPWGEGPAQVLNFAPPTLNVGAPALSATWRHRRAGDGAINWQQPGATGVGDARPIVGARAVSPDPEHVHLEGIEGAVQRMADRPYDNHGFAFSFSGNVEFESSQSRFGRPALEIEYERGQPKEGPDLAVVSLRRAPEFPRASVDAPHRASQDGMDVPIAGALSNPNVKGWPGNGEEVTYTATIKNIGNRPASGFSARWVVRERPGSVTEYDRVLGPGEETTLTFQHGYRDPGADRRGPSVGLRVESKTEDSDPGNNVLSVHEAALTVGFRLGPSVASEIARVKPLGARTPQEFAQAAVDLWNDVLFPQSRFSFAPEGVLDRLRVQSVTEGPDDVGSGPFLAPNLDVSVGLGGDFSFARQDSIVELIRIIGMQLGLPKLEAMNLARGAATIGGMKVDRGAQDAWAGVMGGGDTRFEGVVPPMLTLPTEPFESPMFDAMPAEATGLLSATDVAALQDARGRRRGFEPDVLLRQPAVPLVRLYDLSGLPLKGATVEVYPMAGGKIAAVEPIQRLTSGNDGGLLLASRPTQLPEGFRTGLGYSPGSSPFGRVDPNGQNGVLMLRIIAGGQAEIVFLKAWQLADAYRRNPTPAPFFDLRVNVGGEIDPTTNLANNRIVTDSANSLPAQLAALIDDQASTESSLPDAKDGWIELDLGRDRIFGEIRLLAKGAMWEKFRIVTYATGQTVAEAKLFAREASWTWTAANRAAEEANGVRSITYRNPGLRARFIRIVRISEGGPTAKLTEIKVFPLKG